MHRSQTYYTFEDTLSQIGMGYTFLFVLAFFSMRVWWIALWLILIGYWAAFAYYPLPGSEFDYVAVGVPKSWPYHLSGFAAHWDKNSNLAWAFDTWFLNLFPRARPFAHNGGGYATLSFIPTLATMILGLLAGQTLRRAGPGWAKVLWLSAAGVIGLGVGWGLGELGICPVVKRIWTPSWVLGGFASCSWRASTPCSISWACGFGPSLAGHRYELDRGYCAARSRASSADLTIHLGNDVFKILGGAPRALAPQRGRASVSG
jgi:hypothetical protein